MTNRKQEVIGAIYGGLSPQLEDGYRRKTAERIYDRIALLMLREFPEQGILDILERFLTHRPSTIYITLERFRRLWEGQDHIAEVRKKVREFPEEGIWALKRAEMFLDGLNFSDPPTKPHLCRYCPTKKYDSKVGVSHFNSCLMVDLRNAIVLAETSALGQCKSPTDSGNTYELDSHPCPKCGFPLNAWDKVCPACDLEQGQPKGTCQTCGGSGRDMLEKCPACDGTGECKHKKLEPFRLMFDNDWDVLEIATLPLCVACGVEVDRRSGKAKAL